MPTRTGTAAGICGCGLSLSSVLLWKHDIAYRGDGVFCFLNPLSVHPPANLLDYGQCIPQCDGIPPRRG